MSERICGECQHWARDDVDPGWPDDGICEYPLPMLLEDRVEIAGWDFYIDHNRNASSCACFSPKEEKN